MSNANHPFTHVECEVRTDDLTRQLYATDASIYQIEPRAVAFPRSGAEAAEVIRAAIDAGIAVTPRGAGTGLAGGAVGDGLIVDFARYNQTIEGLDLERRTVRVNAGVVLDKLNAFLRPHGLCFGPDVATSSRATLGGMIANNSSGARAPIYGTTIDHVVSVEAALANGTLVTFGSHHDSLTEQRGAVERIVADNAEAIRARFPDGFVKRWPGYALDDCLHCPGDLSKLIVGSEGTLAGIISAELKLCPLPQEKGLGVVFFASIEEAMQATVELLELKPAAIEHCDHILFDQTKGQLAFQAARDFLELDDKPCEAFLIVEFYNNVAACLAELEQRRLGLRTLICASQTEMDWVWELRKAGLSLLNGIKGAAKPIAGIEDIAVLPQRLPEYIAALRAITERLDLETSFYGHAASGLMHVRPVFDLHCADSIATYRALHEEVSELVLEFHGSLTGEHGVGIEHADAMEKHLGSEIMAATREIKALFDPKGLMNPGKIVPDGRYHIDTNLRLGAGHAIPAPFEPVLMFAAKDESFIGNLEQCNGCGECRKESPTMCPTFTATGEEIMSTRGRTNTIRAVLEGRIHDSAGPLAAAALEEALSNCLSCKACKRECPSNVDMTLLKAELLHARQREHGVALLERLVSRFDLLGEFGCIAPGIANTLLNVGSVRQLMEITIGFAAQRPLPRYTQERFDRWFTHRTVSKNATRGRIILWDDCAVRYHEPHVGQAAVRVLEAAGFEVRLMPDRKCCGRPAFSVGRLDVARRFGEHNVALFNNASDCTPILFLEPSCYSMLKNDYAELGIHDADRVASRCVLFEQFLYDLLEQEPGALAFKTQPAPVAIHGHCHAKALTDVNVMPNLAGRIPGVAAHVLDTGCCGMAGSFGALRTQYDLSLQVAKPLVQKINALEPETRLVASGTSCRQQINHLTSHSPLHMAELLAQALDGS